MTDISEKRTSKTRTLTPLPWAPGEKIDFGACRSLKVTLRSEPLPLLLILASRDQWRQGWSGAPEPRASFRR